MAAPEFSGAGPRLIASRYRPISRLGSGSFGVCWVCQDLHSQSERVVKRVHVGHLDEAAAKRCEEEALLLQICVHPFVLYCHEAFREGPYVCIVTDFCEGGDLGGVIASAHQRGGALSAAQVLEWTVQLCDGLEFLHTRSVLHRDIKPNNVFLTRGIVRLGDFGVARVVADGQRAETMAGTPNYMSPEALAGKGSPPPPRGANPRHARSQRRAAGIRASRTCGRSGAWCTSCARCAKRLGPSRCSASSTPCARDLRRQQPPSTQRRCMP